MRKVNGDKVKSKKLESIENPRGSGAISEVPECNQGIAIMQPNCVTIAVQPSTNMQTFSVTLEIRCQLKIELTSNTTVIAFIELHLFVN
jgi:hypothetical protein